MSGSYWAFGMCRHVVRGLRTPQYGSYASYDLADYERLGDIVVGADVQAHHGLVLAVEDGAEYNGNFFSGRVTADPFGEVEAADTLHHDVDYYKLVERQIVAEGGFRAVGGIHIVGLAFK